MHADVRLRNGHRLRGTGKVLCARDGRLRDVDVRELEMGDWIALTFGDPEAFPFERVALGDFPLSPSYGGQKQIRVPEVLDEDLAMLLGMYASEGHTTKTTWTVVITNGVPAVLAKAAELWQSCFDVQPRVAQYSDKCGATVASGKSIVEVMQQLNCGSRASEKRIPFGIMQSPRDVVISFLRGLWLDAYTSVSGMPRWGLCLDSPPLLDDLQILLRRFGIVTGRVTKYNPLYDKSYDEVYAVGEHARNLVQLVPFLEPYKATAAQRLLEAPTDPRRNGADVVPLVPGRELYAEIPKGHGGRGQAGSGSASRWRSLCDARTIWPSRHMVQRLADAGVRLPADVQRVLDDNLHFSPVVSVA